MTYRIPPLHYDLLRRKTPTAWAFYEFVRDKHATLSNAELEGGRVMTSLNELEETTQRMIHAMLLYERFGQNTFVVGPRVQDLFRRTELAKVTAEMVKAPVPAFYVALPDCPWKIWGGSRTQMHAVRGLYVAVTDSVAARSGELSRGIHFVVWGAPNERSLGPADDALLWYSLNLDGFAASGEDLEVFFRRSSVMRAEPGNLEVNWGGGDPLDSFDGKLLPEDQERLEQQRATLVNLMRVVMNVCLYVASDEPELEVVDNKKVARELEATAKKKKSTAKRKRLERRAASLPKTKIIYIGPLFEQLETTPGTGQGSGGTHATPIEHEVPPHYQHYWVGSGAARKRVLRYKGMYVRGTGRPGRIITKFRE